MHAIIDAKGCNPTLLSRPGTVAILISDIAKALDLHIRHLHVQEFPGPPGSSGPGVSGVALISESHINVHTWPEQGLAQLCVHSCRDFPIGHIVALVMGAFDVQKQDMVKTMVLDR